MTDKELLEISKVVSNALDKLIKDMEKEKPLTPVSRRWRFEFDLFCTDGMAKKVYAQIKHDYPDYINVGCKVVSL